MIIAWILIQLLIFVLSVRFVVVGIRTLSANKKFAYVLFFFGFIGIFLVAWNITEINIL